MRVALMRAAILRPFERFLRRIGAPVERICERVHLPPEALRDAEGLVPVHLGTAFVTAAARGEGIPHLGATVAASTRVADLGSYGRALGQACSLPDALATVRRFHAGHCSAEVYWLDADEARPLLCQRFTVQLDDPHGQMSQYSIFLAADLVRAMTRGSWRPTVRLRKGLPASIAETPWMERADLRFDRERCAIEIDPSVVPMTGSSVEPCPPALRALTDWYRTRPADELVPSLRQWLDRVLQTDVVRIEVLAATIGTTPRTLQRRLGEVGTNYARVLGAARFDAAARLLAHEDVEIRDVARAVGYRDPAHLTRAFHRWSGTTPSRYRRRLRAATTAVALSTPSLVATWQAIL